MTARWWPALLLGAAFVPGVPVRAQFVPPVEYGYSLPSVTVAGLQSSHDCQTSLPTFGHPDYQYWPPQGRIAMSNDGGWCWVQFGQVFRALQFVPETIVVDQPANGQVTLEKMKDRISVAYRPSPGFTGADQFAVRTEGPFPHTIPFAVIVR
jgi:hypothetical protein